MCAIRSSQIRSLPENSYHAFVLLFLVIIITSIFIYKIDEEVAKLLKLKAQLGEDGPHKFTLKTPKVCCHLLKQQSRIFTKLHLIDLFQSSNQ